MWLLFNHNAYFLYALSKAITVGQEIFAVENFRGFVIFNVLREYFVIFIFTVRGDHENFITVQFPY